MNPALVAACAAGAGVAGLLVPWLVRRLPEPERDESAEGEPSKPLYADLGARPGLAWKSALASAVGAALVAASVGNDWWLVVLVPLVPVCVALSFIDWHTRLLPAVIVLPATAYAVLAGLAGWPLTGDPDDLVRAALGLVIARSVYWLLWFIHSAGMGFGDVRLAALLGFALGHVGWGEFGVGMYAGFLVFGVPGLVLALLRWDRTLLKTAYPFGPFMILGALLGLLVGAAVADYLVGG
ncbi:A24 family peptidase [Nocardioides sp.]|uniref:A24 family peptidase n=1 Tax=Nocardioides sp. TaxID=35761 RepID=UPI002ED5FB20